jgi:hypothetical protein
VQLLNTALTNDGITDPVAQDVLRSIVGASESRAFVRTLKSQQFNRRPSGRLFHAIAKNAEATAGIVRLVG